LYHDTGYTGETAAGNHRAAHRCQIGDHGIFIFAFLILLTYEHGMHDTAMKIGKAFFDTYLKDAKGLTIVDIGSQDVNGSLRSVAPLNNKYIGVDFVEGKGVDIIITDPYALPFEDNSADVVVCSSCFEHSEFFWVLFNEIQRILKPDGLFYLNVPSNGMFHRYPVDCWRFYPDSGIALQNWGRRSGYSTTLLESFIGNQEKDGWNDFVAVFIKDGAFVYKYHDRIQTRFDNYTNSLMCGSDNFSNYSTYSNSLESKVSEANDIAKAIHQPNLPDEKLHIILKKLHKNTFRKFLLKLIVGRKTNKRIESSLKEVSLSAGIKKNFLSPLPFLEKGKVSILLTTYNGASYIAEQLDSIRGQSYQDIEIIIGDDGSKDTTVNIIKKYMLEDSRILLFQHDKNLGCDKNFEFLCSKATGKYIAFSDQDDIWHKEKIARLLCHIDNCDLVYGPSILVDEYGNSLQKTLLYRNNIEPLSGQFIFKMLEHNRVSGHAMLCKSDFILRNLPIHTFRLPGDDVIPYDYYFALCANFQNGFKYVENAITFHRMHQSNLTNNPLKGIKVIKNNIYSKISTKYSIANLVFEKSYFIMTSNKIQTLDTDFFSFRRFFSLMQEKNYLSKCSTKITHSIYFSRGKSLIRITEFFKKVGVFT
jgi:glycosyltransferase involved in cell wall biosynthesis/SAM-dependent methyltransferase